MSTSLAEQLQRLAVPQTARLQQDKKRASLLFDPKEAASLNKETVYQIGVDGLEELKERNIVFAEFENTLFHITSKDFERSIETAQANQKLDKNIRRFLYLLSPHFMFNCSYKALEWLVYRYYIHEYNKEDLLMLILPYHETNIFVRTLQLLNLKNSNDKWHWLKPLQKTGVHLTKQVLYNNLAANAHFLECIANYVLSIVKEHENPSCLTVVYNFYCSSFAGALEYTRDVNELQISQMLPVLLEGLSSTIPDFAASSYVICAQLLSKIQLSSKVLDKFTSKISQMQVPKLKNEAVLLLLLLYQTQKNHTSMANIKILNSQPGFVKVIEKYSREGMHIDPLMISILKSSIKEILVNNDDRCKLFIDEILNEVKFDNSFIDPFIRSLLEICSQHIKSANETGSWVKDLLCKIERQYPAAFDKAIKDIMKPTKNPTLIQKTICKILGDVGNIDSMYDLMEKLYNPSSGTRLESVKLLRKKFDVFRERDCEAIENAILDRIKDDCVEVSYKTLREFRSKFAILNLCRLKNVLLEILIRCQNDRTWLEVLPITLELLCQYYNESDIQIFLTVLPFLLPISDDEVRTARLVLKSTYGTRSKLLSPILDDLENASVSNFSTIVYKNLCKNKQRLDINLLAKTLKEMPEKSTNALYKYMALLMVCSALPPTTDFGVACLVLDIIEIYMSEHVISPTEPIISSYILLARKNKLSLQCLLDCLQNLIMKISFDNVSFNYYDFNQNEISDFIIRLLQILIRGTSNKKPTQSNAYKTVLGVFLKRFCSNDVILISEFLLNLLISNHPLIDDQFRFSCALLVKSIKTKNVKLPSKSFVIPYLLVGFTTHNVVLRKEFADILTLYNTNLKRNHVAYPFLVQFCQHLEEVVMDHEGSAQVMQTICTTTDAFVCQLIELLCGNFQLYFKAGILTLLHKIADFDTYNKTSEPAIEILKNNKDTFNIPESKIIEVNIGYLNHHLAMHVNQNSTVWSFITLCIRNDKSTFRLTDEKQTCPSALLLQGIDREVFLHLKEDMKKLLLNEIVEVATITENPEVLQAASHALKRIELDSSLILEQLHNMRDVRSPSANPQKLKRRVNIVPTADILETVNWRKGVTVLEFIQDKKKIRRTSLLLSTLFEILKKCLDFEEQANVEYPKQLLLSTILHCCQKSDNRIPEGAFDMQLVVQCIRASQNPQTHHHALLLLAEIASIIPKQVLHHIIAIFTFMGSSVLRHDDEYSFQIITKIIDTVTPILIEDGKTESVAQVLRVFVDAILDIPEHRHMRLFKQLLTRIDAKENLHLFLLIVFEAQVVHGQVEKQKTNNKSLTNSEAPKRLDIAADLCREFSPEIVISTCIKVLQYLCKLPEEKKNDTQNINDYTFDIQRYTSKQFRHYKYIIILFVYSLLSSKQFVTQVATLSDTEMQQLENLFKEAIIVILKHSQTTAKSVESNINTPQSQYWRVMLHYSCDTLDALNSLLTEKMFLLVIRGLMVYSLSTIRKRALDLLNNKLQDKTDFMNECNEEELYNVIVTPLVNIIKTIEEPDIDSDQEQVIQKAFVSLKLLVRNIGADNPQKFKQILDFTAELVQTGRGTINDNVMASAILCIAELCNELRAHAISSLHKCMPVMLKLLKPNKDAIPSLLLTSNVAAINKILDSLSLFLSPFLKKLLCGVSILAAKWGAQLNDQKLTAFTTKIQSVQLKLGQLVPLRVLLPAVQESYTVLVNKGNFSAIEPLMKVLCESLNTLKGNDIQSHLPDLTNFFLQALQFRTDSKCDENVEQIEENIIKAIGSLVLKLSETTFRPLYYKIFDWAVRTDVKTERIITFYNLSHVFANCLKGLFSLFAGHFLNNAAKLLDDCNRIKSETLHFEDSSKNATLIENILKTLHTIFMYDSQKFVNKERFEVLMQPIVDQLENTLGGLDDLEMRANKILIPCIVQFAVATADDSLWKQMNYQILLKTRHNTSKIRLMALNAVGETAKKLGEDFLPLLPETIPFLAELLEDEDETVEKSCQKMLQELEKVLGEPLQKYF